MNDEFFIRKTFDLARRALGQTWPNPLVGAVIVKNGKVIGEGYHHQAGLDHAEVDAFKNCSESPAGATLYVNLEPCCHLNKKTPPCAQRLILEKIKKVVICNLDPNQSVNGQGIELLKQAGIEVKYGVLSDEGERLNEVFFFAQRKQKPFVHLKMATTLDGKMAMNTGESQWITSPVARTHVHELRALHQAVMVGAETVRKDNPKLNVRLAEFQGKQPQRIIFTKSGKLPKDAQLFTDELKSQTFVYTQNELSIPFPIEQIIRINSLEEAMNDMFEKRIINVFLEGGSTLASEFLKLGLVNRITLMMNPSFLGSGLGALGDLGVTKLNERPRLKNSQSRWIGEDLLITGEL